MAPQHDSIADTPTRVSTTTDTPAPIKNAFAREVEHDTRDFSYLTPVNTDSPIDLPNELPYEDRGLFADPTLKNLLTNATVKHYNPKIGTEITGLQLHELTDAQKDELALLVSERGVVFFRDQQITMAQQIDWAKHYGTVHVHPSLPHPKGYEPLFAIRNTLEMSEAIAERQLYDPVGGWHSDVSFERQPTSYTMLKIMSAPPLGGDTLWSSSYEAYESLTPAFRKFLEGLTAIHSSKAQAEFALKQGIKLRRPIVESEHPIVRTHPVTGRKALYVNYGFTVRIKQLSVHESDAVLRFLFHHVANGAQFQTRFQWEHNSVAIWDNRVTQHFATFDYLPGVRYGHRVMAHGEIPFFKE